MPRTPGSPNKPKPIDHLKKITCEPCVIDCEDCGNKYPRVVTHTRIEKPVKHWRHKCNCGRFYNPITHVWEHTTAMQLNQQIREANKKVPAE